MAEVGSGEGLTMSVEMAVWMGGRNRESLDVQGVVEVGVGSIPTVDGMTVEILF